MSAAPPVYGKSEPIDTGIGKALDSVAEEEAPKEPEAEAATEATEENKDKPACTTHVCHNKVKKLI